MRRASRCTLYSTKKLADLLVRLALATYRRKLGLRPTTAQKLELHKRQDHLQARIDGFKGKAALAFGDLDLDEIEDLLEDEDAPLDRVVDQDTGSDDQSDGAKLGRPHSNIHSPESWPLLLPSTLGWKLCQQLGLQSLISMELRLREGQANDALHGLKIALCEKAVLYRAEVRHANSQVKKTRAWANVNAVEGIVRAHSKIYRRSRQAMIRLGAQEDLLKKYQVLKREELKVSTEMIDPSIPGH